MHSVCVAVRSPDVLERKSKGHSLIENPLQSDSLLDERSRPGKRVPVRAVLVREISVSPARGFEQEPRPALRFIDPNFDETCRCDVAMFVTHVVSFAQACGKRFVVVHQFGEHVQWLDVFGIVIQHPLSTRDLSDRMQREAADLANAFRDNVGHCEELLGVFIEKQVIIPEVVPAHVPVKILGLQVKREHICEDCVQRA